MNNELLPSNNAPRPQKFLNEVNEIMPLLQANGTIPKQGVNGQPMKVNRKQAREMGFKSSKEANTAINAKEIAQRTHEWRSQRMGETVEKEIKALHPFLTRIANMTGWMWLYKLAFLSWNVKGGKDEVEGVPDIECSWVNIYRFGKPIKIIRLVWEDHNQKKKVII